eukprot:TRINITY_DN32254_c0_g1_i1.p1 TRINITY_DN32254_c0_g1~~TRINITY_DN32254_c0_g1_i1.p1  ORF type:complete len:536 (-),score=83.82 TRINITY_DN32254_c0_g1_i1:118-1725(-)
MPRVIPPRAVAVAQSQAPITLDAKEAGPGQQASAADNLQKSEVQKVGQDLAADRLMTTLSKEVYAIVTASTTAVGLKRFAAASTDEAVTPKLLQARLQSICISAVQTCGGESSEGELLLLGAHHLGVEAPDAATSAHPAADEALDLVYVTTSAIQVDELVTRIGGLLTGLSSIKTMSPAAPDGFLSAPGLEFCLEGYPVKLLVSKQVADIPRLSKNSSAIPYEIAGLIARQVTESILESVPDQGLFRQLLRCVRHWAKRRGIYGQAQEFGYMGGIGWAVCCARVCQVEQSTQLSQLMNAFFSMYSNWDFTCPIQLFQGDPSLPTTIPARHEEGKMIVRMPVGDLNATPNVTPNCLKVIRKELRRAADISGMVLKGSESWTRLLSKASFFTSHRHYLELDFMGSSKEVMTPWLAWARQQLRGIAQLFDCLSACKLVAKPWPAWIPFKDSTWSHATAVFFALRVVEKPQDQSRTSGKVVIDLREVVVQILEKMCGWPDGPKFEGQYDLYVRHSTSEDVQQWIRDVEQARVIRRPVSR